MNSIHCVLRSCRMTMVEARERVFVASSGACTLMAFRTRAYQARHFLCRPRPLRFLRNLLTDPDLLHPCLLPLLPHSKRCNGKRPPNLLVVQAAAEMYHFFPTVIPKNNCTDRHCRSASIRQGARRCGSAGCPKSVSHAMIIHYQGCSLEICRRETPTRSTRRRRRRGPRRDFGIVHGQALAGAPDDA